jgi:hypothetical protein
MLWRCISPVILIFLLYLRVINPYKLRLFSFLTCLLKKGKVDSMPSQTQRPTPPSPKSAIWHMARVFERHCGQELGTSHMCDNRYVNVLDYKFIPSFQTSDVGEAFRPVVSPRIVTAAYGISWLYLAGSVYLPLSCVTRPDTVCSDVSYEAYKARRQGPSPLEAAHFSEPTRLGMVAVKRAVFQSIASMSVFLITANL